MASITTTLRLVKRLAVAGVLVLGVSGCMGEGWLFGKGYIAYSRGDYKTAYKEYLW